MDWPLCCGRCHAPSRRSATRRSPATCPPRRTANRLDPAALRRLLARQPPQRTRRCRSAGSPPSPGCRARSLAYAMPQICTPAELAGLHIASRPRARDGWSFAACRPCTAGQPGHPVGAARRRRLPPAPPLDQQRPRAAGPHRPAGDPHRAPPPPAADPPARPGHRHAGVPRRTRICLGWRLDGCPTTASAAAWRSSTAPAGTTATTDGPDLRRRHLPADRRAGPAARQPVLARTHPRHPLGRARRIHRRTTPHRRTRLHLGLPAAPAGAATATTRCSNGDYTPAAWNSSRSRPAIPGTCPKPSSRPHSPARNQIQ